MASGCLALTFTLALVLAPPAAPPAPAPPDTSADVLTLRDGSVVLGQVVETAPRGPLVMYVRRAWAEASLPDRARRWTEAEKPLLRKAYQTRLDRLAAWRRERVKDSRNPDGDVIDRWLARQLDRLGPPADPPPAPLMVVTLNRTEVKGLVRRPRATARMLRQGWLSGFRDVETMPMADLKAALEDRGFATGKEKDQDDPPVKLDKLLPILPETEAEWLTRRAATELCMTPGCVSSRFRTC